MKCFRDSLILQEALTFQHINYRNHANREETIKNLGAPLCSSENIEHNPQY